MSRKRDFALVSNTADRYQAQIARLTRDRGALREALDKINTISSTPAGWRNPIMQRGRISKIADAALAATED